MAIANLADELGAAWLTARYLYGIDLTDDDGTAYPDELFESAIESAIDTLEEELSLTIRGLRTITREHVDVLDWEASSWHLNHLQRRPVRSVSEMVLQLGSYPATALPSEWIHLASEIGGQVQLIPSGSTGNATLNIVGGLLLGTDFAGRGYIPGWFRYTYVAGFESQRFGLALGTFDGTFGIDGPLVVRPSAASAGGETFTVTISGVNKSTGLADTEAITWAGTTRERKQSTKEWSDLTSVVFTTDGASTPTFDIAGTNPVPANMLDAIGLMAAILPLDTAGDLIAGAGIASKSISMDGISESINTTSSATNSGYNARALSYQKRLKALVTSLRSKWVPMRMGAI